MPNADLMDDYIRRYRNLLPDLKTIESRLQTLYDDELFGELEMDRATMIEAGLIDLGEAIAAIQTLRVQCD